MQIDFNHYAQIYARERRVQPALLAQLVQVLELRPGDPVLEVGCGTGNYLAALCRETGALGHGIDPAGNMLAEAAAQSPDLVLSIGQAERIPHPDQSMSAIYSVDVIHFVGDVAAYAGEAFRVLKPGGRFATATDSEDDIRGRVPLRSHFPETIEVELARYPAVAVQEQRLSEAGFVDIGHIPVRFEYDLTDISPYRARAFSSLRLISDEAFAAGLARLERDLAQGPVRAVSRYTVITARKPT